MLSLSFKRADTLAEKSFFYKKNGVPFWGTPGLIQQ
jgi:hypothetical protein